MTDYYKAMRQIPDPVTCYVPEDDHVIVYVRPVANIDTLRFACVVPLNDDDTPNLDGLLHSLKNKGCVPFAIETYEGKNLLNR